jgi:ABC-type nitrate/sulfonate/bicarbonate transport system permease component
VIPALGTWDILSRSGIVSADAIPPATAVLAQLADQVSQAEYWDAVEATVRQWALGLLLSSAVAIPLGIVMGSVEAIWRAFRPIVEFMRPVSGMALVPLAVLLWGLSTTSVVILILFGCVWSLIVLCMYGAQWAGEAGSGSVWRRFCPAPICCRTSATAPFTILGASRFALRSPVA